MAFDGAAYYGLPSTHGQARGRGRGTGRGLINRPLTTPTPPSAVAAPAPTPPYAQYPQQTFQPNNVHAGRGSLYPQTHSQNRIWPPPLQQQLPVQQAFPQPHAQQSIPQRMHHSLPQRPQSSFSPASGQNASPNMHWTAPPQQQQHQHQQPLSQSPQAGPRTGTMVNQLGYGMSPTAIQPPPQYSQVQVQTQVGPSSSLPRPLPIMQAQAQAHPTPSPPTSSWAPTPAGPSTAARAFAPSQSGASALPSQLSSFSASSHTSASSSGSRPKPKSYCETCSLSFPSPILLIAHQRNEHVRCALYSPIQGEGCKFEGLRAAVELHEQDRHLIFKEGAAKEPTRPDGPLNARIQGTAVKLETDEEIAAWLAERRRKWPSAANADARREREAKKRRYEEDAPNAAVQSNGARGRGRGVGRGDGRERGRGRGGSDGSGDRGRGRGRGRGMQQDSGWGATQQRTVIPNVSDSPDTTRITVSREIESRQSLELNGDILPGRAEEGHDSGVESIQEDEEEDEDEEEAARIAMQLVARPAPRPVKAIEATSSRLPSSSPLEDGSTPIKLPGTAATTQGVSTIDEAGNERRDGVIGDDDDDEEVDIDGRSIGDHASETSSQVADVGGELVERDDDDDDSAPEAESSKTQPVPLPLPVATAYPPMVNAADRQAPEQKKPCRTFVSTGRCKFGSSCRYSHESPVARKAADTSSNTGNRQLEPPRRKNPTGPPPPPSNPFARDDLLGKLLLNEIRHEVSDLRQVIDFLARNRWLENVELYPGHKEEKENRIKEVAKDLGKREGGNDIMQQDALSSKPADLES